MSDPLGLSIGTTNLVAARVGDPPLVRRAVLNLFSDRAPQLGVPADDSGVELTGFVERVGDPVPLVASDGTSYHADQLVVEALDALIEAIGGEPPSGQLAISVPAHWDTGALRAMRAAMRTNPTLAPNGVPARLVSDAMAALTALHADPGLPSNGIVALMDFGGGGTSITLADAAAAFEPVATSRLTEFSGDRTDQALLAQVLDSAAHTGDAVALGDDTTGTAEVSALATLRDACRVAKEQLSTAQTAEITVGLPDYDATVQITRAELESVLRAPLSVALNELDDLLQRNNIGWSKVKAVATVGGGAQIPLVAATVAEHVRSHSAGIPVVSTAGSAVDAAVGATLFAAFGADADAKTGMAPAALLAGTEALGELDAGPATEAEPAPVVGGTSGFRALAWSQDEDATDDVLPYTGEDSYDTTTTRAVSQYVPAAGAPAAEPSKAWQRFPLVVFGLAALAAIVAGGVAINLTGHSGQAPAPSTPPPVTTPPSIVPPVLSSVVPPPPPPPPVTEAPPSTVTVTEPPPPPPTHTYVPPPTHTAPPVPHTTVTHAPTTTEPPPPPPTTSEPPPPPPVTTTTTTPTMTTAYVRLPFVPVPIPIQVPKGADPTTPQYAPANPYSPGYQQQYPGYQQSPGYSPYGPNQGLSPYQPYQP